MLPLIARLSWFLMCLYFSGQLEKEFSFTYNYTLMEVWMVWGKNLAMLVATETPYE